MPHCTQTTFFSSLTECEGREEPGWMTCLYFLNTAFSACCVPDGVAGALRGPLQPYDPLRPPHLLQLGAQAAIQKHLLLLPAPHLQAEGGEAALRRRDSHYSHLQIYPSLQLWGVQLSREQHPPKPSRLSRPGIVIGLGPHCKAIQSILVDYWIKILSQRTAAQDACCHLGSDHSEQAYHPHIGLKIDVSWGFRQNRIYPLHYVHSISANHTKHISPAHKARHHKLLLPRAGWRPSSLRRRAALVTGLRNS